MKNLLGRIDRNQRIRMLIIAGGIATNVCLSYLVTCLNFPIYLDTVGTVFAAAMTGVFGGIWTAVASNILISIFQPESFYYMLISILMAICTAWFVREKTYLKKWGLPALIITLGVISGGLGIMFQWLLVGYPEVEEVVQTAELLAHNSKTAFFFYVTLLNVALNTLDKGITVLLAILMFHWIPTERRTKTWNAGWRQKPLSQEEIKQLVQSGGEGISSLRNRIGGMVIMIALLLAVSMTLISLRTHRKHEQEKALEEAYRIANLAATTVKTDRLEDYIKKGRVIGDYEEDSYRKTAEEMKNIKMSFPDVIGLYVMKVQEDGNRIIFDTDVWSQSNKWIGKKEPQKEIFLPQQEKFLAGGEIDGLVWKSDEGQRATACVPLFTAGGDCIAYLEADLSISEAADYEKSFIINIILGFSGFFVLILGYGLSVSGYYLVYPIGSIVKYTEDFIEGIEDQTQLDENVRKLRKLDVRTGDEVERLYHAISEMAAGTAEQMRSIRYLANSTEQMQNGLIITMADLVENRDSDSGFHVQKTTAYVRIIAEGLKKKGYYAEKLTPKFMKDVVTSAPLHDVGKINIPDYILNKPEKLTEEEYEIMKTHTTMGKEIMEQAISTVNGENYLKEARNMAAYHHERWDGKGYPEGLHGQVIPLSARIMAVADVFDEITSSRVNQAAIPWDKALKSIEEGAGTQFDPKCVEVFLESVPEIKQVLRKYQDR